jgi:hypothetical protein
LAVMLSFCHWGLFYWRLKASTQHNGSVLRGAV